MNQLHHALRLGHFGEALADRFERDGVQADGDGAIHAFRVAIAGVPPEHPARAIMLSRLGIALRIRATLNDARFDAFASVDALREAVRITQGDDRYRAARLSSLGSAWDVRFAYTGAMSDLDASIDAHRKAVAVIEVNHPDLIGCLVGLAGALKHRYGCVGSQDDLNAAVDAGRAAIDATPPGHPDRPAVLCTLGDILRMQYESTRLPEILDTAIDLLQEAAAAKSLRRINRQTTLVPLATALRLRFERHGRQADIDAAIEAIETAAHGTATGGVHRARLLSDWGTVLCARYDRSAASADIDAAINFLQQAEAAATDDHPDRAGLLSNLGSALMNRFQRMGARADVDAAIDVLGEAVAKTSSDHPKLAGRLSNLGGAHWLRFDRVGAQQDLNTAIEHFEAAVVALPEDHAERSATLSNLSGALQRRFERAGVPADADAAVEAASAAVAASLDDSIRAWCLSNLGTALRSRFDGVGDPGDLDAAIDVQREAVAATSADHPVRAKYLNNLADVLLARGGQAGDGSDVEVAGDAARAAVAATSSDHPDQAGRRSTLGHALYARFLLRSDPADRSDAVDHYERAVDVVRASPSIRIRAARAASLLVASKEPARAAMLLRRAVLLLPEVTPRHLERDDQEHALSGFSELAVDAAALSLADPSLAESERAVAALGLLELGRALLFSQALDVRSDLSELAESHPVLADRFIALRDLLDRPADAVGIAGRFTTQRPTSLAHEPDRSMMDRRRLSDELADVISEIRDVEGFSSFGRPPSGDELLDQAAHGPVIVFNVSRFRSDALVMTPSGIHSMRLSGLEYNEVAVQVTEFQQALRAIRVAPGRDDRAAAQAQLSKILAWLWDRAISPIRDLLTDLVPGFGVEGNAVRPRVWWVSSGLFGLLPVHAAGHYDETRHGSPKAVMDLVVSSYTPTIRALRHAREEAVRRSTAAASGTALIVAMPTTPGVPGRLPYALDEARRILTHLPDSTLLTEPDARDDTTQPPTLARVLGLLSECPIVHFACHGTSKSANPSQSHLLLHDHRQHPLTVRALTSVHLDVAQLAYLSACETALTANIRLLDESIHLMSAFQLAGYPHVIGTLWAINDRIAADIADNFYAALTDPILDTQRAAYALDRAIQEVRTRFPNSPSLWAAYIHTGA